MRKNFMAGLALALTLGGAGLAAAQSTGQQPQRPRGEQGDRGGRGWGRGGPRGGPEGFLLRGITLTDAQKQKVQQLHESDRAQMEKSRDQFRSRMDSARAARQRGDSTKAKALFDAMRKDMDARRDQHASQIRSILTAEQQKQFDANLAEAKKREAERGPGRGFGPRGDHGDHGKRGDRDGGRDGQSKGK